LAAIFLNVLVSYFLSNYVRFFTIFKAGGKILLFQGFWALGPQKKTSRNGTRVFCGDKSSQSGYNLKEKCHMSPSLDNDFELVARTM
jgi:hypothetical protein